MYFLFLAIWYFGCHFFGIEINSPGKIIASTISCLSCLINMRTETDIVEWYIPAQLFIYLIFPLLYMFIKKVSALRTPYVILYYLFFVGLGIGLSVFASRPLYLRMPVIFIGTLAFFCSGGQKLDLIIFISAISFFFVPQTYALSTSLIMPLMLYAYNCIIKSVTKINYISKILRIFDYLGKHSLEIYLAQAFTTQYFLKYADQYNILIAWSLTVLLTVFISVILFAFQKYFYTIIRFIHK